MAKECNGAWETTLFYSFKDGEAVDPPLQVADGINTIANEDGQGNISGKHHNSGGNIKGKCKHGSKHVLSFERPEGNNIFRYLDGEVKGNKISGGTFIVESQNGHPGEGDSGTWESSKEGSPGPPPSEDEQGEEQGQSNTEDASEAY